MSVPVESLVVFLSLVAIALVGAAVWLTFAGRNFRSGADLRPQAKPAF